MTKTSVPELLEFLFPRVGFLDGVTLTGGEPLLHRGLVDFLRELKKIGYNIKLDTNASRVESLEYVIEKKLVDYLSVKIVSSFRRYSEVSGYSIKPEIIEKAIHIIRRSNVVHEFVFMPVPSVNETSDLLEVANLLAGSRRFVIKMFHPELSADETCRNLKPYTLDELEKFRNMITPYFHEVEIIS